MKYRHLFFDLDHTLWDFDTNARDTLHYLYNELQLENRGIYDFELFYSNYLVHNALLWKRYRNGFIKQSELRIKRMRLSLLDFKIADEELAEKMNRLFLELLPTRKALFPGAIELLEYLKNSQYRLHLITNGFEEVQYQKIKSSAIHHYFEQIITSESSNSLKPHAAIFNYAIHCSGADRAESLMIGDDLEADIIGASLAGIDQVFVNYKRAPADFKPTYTVHSLEELMQIL